MAMTLPYRQHLLFLVIAALPISCVHATPFAEVSFSNVPGSVTGFPTVEATDAQVCCGSGHGYASVPAGLMKAELTAQSPFNLPGGASAYTVRVAIHDEFISTSGVLGMPFRFPTILRVSGTGVAPLIDADTSAPGGQSFGFVRGVVGNFDAVTYSFTTSTPVGAEVQVAPDIPFPISFVATGFIDGVFGQQVPLTYTLIIQGVNETVLDVFNTAQLSFALPPGVSISSAGGYFQEATVTPIPEPSTFGAASLAIFAILAAKRTRARISQK